MRRFKRMEFFAFEPLRIRIPPIAAFGTLLHIFLFSDTSSSFAINAAIDVIDWSSIPTPSQFIHCPNPPVAYFTVNNKPHAAETNGENGEKPRTFRCNATGNPHPSYSWNKNGKPLPPNIDTDRIVRGHDDGSLTFLHFEERDQGVYQCLASNDNGTAVGERVSIEKAWQNHFAPDEHKGFRQPQIVKLELGEPYSRNCSAPDSNPAALVFWLLASISNPSDIQAINSSHISSNERGTIFFHYVTESDFKPNQLYTCTAYNKELQEYKQSSNQFNFEIKRTRREKMQLTPSQEQYVNQSSPVALLGTIHKLHCFFSGYPDPIPTWFRNGEEIMPNNTKGFTFENFGRTLAFNVTMEHFGRYECKFQRESLDRRFDIKVNAAPYWHDQPPSNTNTSEGETVVFDCKAKGLPTPMITFYKNGVEMRRPRSGENWVIDGSRLTIFDVKKGANGAGDNAVYQCKAENRHGYLWTNFYLNLLAYQPKLLEDRKLFEAVEGRPFSIYCKFFASPMANVSWESPALLGTEHYTKVDQFGTGWLMFERINPSHAGEYHCTGVNKYGSATGSLRLVVRKPTIVKQQAEQARIELQAGAPLRLRCDAEHDPDLGTNWLWNFDGLPLDEKPGAHGHFQVLEDHSLLIESPREDDSGTYTCVVSTSLDKASTKVEVLIEDVSPPVQSASVFECDPSGFSARIKFQHVEQAYRPKPVKEFWIRYLSDPDVESGKWTVYPVPVLAIKSELINDDLRVVRGDATIQLRPFGTYMFQIIARNEIGDSSPFQVSQRCQTDQKPPDRNPGGVRVEGSQPDNLIIYWDPMLRDEWNADSFAYKVFYRKQGDSGAPWTEVSVDDPFADKLTIDLGDKQLAWDPYEVQVKAINSQGTSLIEPLIIVGRTGEGDPGVTPTNFHVRNIKATSADFYWTPVDPNKVQGNFTGYKITYWYNEEDNDQYDSFETVSNSNQKENPDTSMEVQEARAKRNHKRTRRSSSPLLTSSSFNQQSIAVPASATRVTITNLKPNTLNYAHIAVTNGQNEGSPSMEISFRTSEGVPSEVRRLSAYSVNNRAPSERAVVFLKWYRPKSSNGRMTNYVAVRCLRPDQDRSASDCDSGVIVPIANTELRVIGLDYSTVYQFRVYAVTRAGQGLPNSIDVKTLPQALHLDYDPVRPDLTRQGIADDHFNVSFVPGAYDPNTEHPVGNHFYVKYKEADVTEDWKVKYPSNESTLAVKVDGLQPGTKYDVVAVSVQKDGPVTKQSESRLHHISTSGVSPRQARIFWILVVLLLLLLLLLLICIACLLMRNRGRKYPVSEKERLHGRDPALAYGQRTFEEYGRVSDDERRSLTGHSHASESDSMAEFVDTDPRNFDEDGSFINQYGPGKTALVVTSTARQS